MTSLTNKMHKLLRTIFLRNLVLYYNVLRPRGWLGACILFFSKILTPSTFVEHHHPNEFDSFAVSRLRDLNFKNSPHRKKDARLQFWNCRKGSETFIGKDNFNEMRFFLAVRWNGYSPSGTNSSCKTTTILSLRVTKKNLGVRLAIYLISPSLSLFSFRCVSFSFSSLVFLTLSFFLFSPSVLSLCVLLFLSPSFSIVFSYLHHFSLLSVFLTFPNLSKSFSLPPPFKRLGGRLAHLAELKKLDKYPAKWFAKRLCKIPDKKVWLKQINGSFGKSWKNSPNGGILFEPLS